MQTPNQTNDDQFDLIKCLNDNMWPSRFDFIYQVIAKMGRCAECAHSSLSFSVGLSCICVTTISNVGFITIVIESAKL